MLIHRVGVAAVTAGATELLRSKDWADGDATQRRRLCRGAGGAACGHGSDLPVGGQRTSVVEFLKAYKLFMAALLQEGEPGSPTRPSERRGGKRRLHIVDLSAMRVRWRARCVDLDTICCLGSVADLHTICSVARYPWKRSRDVERSGRMRPWGGDRDPHVKEE
ncbi:hypothetical protein ZWY2020_001122 [Hordeum vulgare]|nr:hypothetical protein ZWY2020_001122 [Hordeum vulgare]